MEVSTLRIFVRFGVYCLDWCEVSTAQVSTLQRYRRNSWIVGRRLSESATAGMRASTTYLGNAAVFCVLAILAAVFAVSLSPATTGTMRTFLILSHLNPLLSRSELLV